jgi:hypothetical protein
MKKKKEHGGSSFKKTAPKLVHVQLDKLRYDELQALADQLQTTHEHVLEISLALMYDTYMREGKLKKFHWICRNKRCKEDEREVLSEPGGEGELACNCCGYFMERLPQF